MQPLGRFVKKNVSESPPSLKILEISTRINLWKKINLKSKIKKISLITSVKNEFCETKDSFKIKGSGYGYSFQVSLYIDYKLP